MSNLAQVHGPGAARQFFGQQAKAADRLGHDGLRLSFGIGSLGLGTEEFFSFVQKIKAHCVWLLLGSPTQGVKKSRPYRCAAWAATPDRPGKLRRAQLALRRSSLLPYPTTYISLVKPFEARRLSGALTRARCRAISGQTSY